MSAIHAKNNSNNRQLQHRQQYRVLDNVQRNRRVRHHLEQLERDNFHDDPHANLVMHKKAPKFEDNKQTTDSSSGGNRSWSSSSAAKRARPSLPRSRMCSFQALIEDVSKSSEPNYCSAASPPPTMPPTLSPSTPSKDQSTNSNTNSLTFHSKRHFCSVCGFVSSYTCVSCGMRYCSLNCFHTHSDTRCLKWTV